MLTVCYGAKGGQGVTTVTAGLAVADAMQSVVVVDTGGDLPAVLGIREPGGPGLVELLAGEGRLTADAVAALARPVGLGVDLVPGPGPVDAVPGARWAELAEVLRDDGRRWLVDAGVTAAPALATDASQALLVTTNCYLALHRARLHPVRPTGVVLVQDLDRAFREQDVTRVVDAPVVATIVRDPQVARATDAGLLVGRMPERLRRALARLAGTIW